MLRPHGYITISDPDQPQCIEADSVQCGHCQQVIRVKPGSASTVYLVESLETWVHPQHGPGHRIVQKEEAGAFCRVCMRPICLQCCDLGRCTPWEQKIDAMESKSRMLKTIGVALCALFLLAKPAAAQSYAQFIAGERLSGISGVTTTIETPTSSATYDAGTSDTLTTLGGTATSAAGAVIGCTWSNNLGGNGSATGTTSWSVASIPLTIGTNVITVTCMDNLLAQGDDVLSVTRAASGVCDQTLSTADNILAAVIVAPNDTTICLTSGNYGIQNFNNVGRTGYVTLRSVTGIGAQISPNLGNTHFIKFSNLTLTSMDVSACSTNIHTLSSTFVQGAAGLFFNNRDAPCAVALNHVVDGVTFTAATFTGGEGVLSITGHPSSVPSGIVIRNSIFDATYGDGIQGFDSCKGITIGPGNVFKNIVQDGLTHFDGIQFYCNGSGNIIEGNWFSNLVSCCALTHHSNVPTGTIFRDNILNNIASYQVGLGSAGFIYDHNTARNVSDLALRAFGGNITARSNIFVGTMGYRVDNDGTFATTITYSLCDGTDCPAGANQIIATPVFVGGSNPDLFTTFAEWRLAIGSPGKNAGHDGNDIGITSP